jgi:predicted dehydrogenase
MNTKNNRRDFLKKITTASLGFTVVPNIALGKMLGHISPSDKLNIAVVGAGGKGIGDTNDCATENIVALCDVDMVRAKVTFDKYSKAKKYWDWRKMFDEMDKSIDAVVISTPDHTHATIAAHAMTLGKHVYVQKPLTLTVFESRLLTQLADKYKVATQMGNQGASGEGVRQICDWICDGQIGEIKEVHAWTNRPGWPQGLSRPTEIQPIPDTLNWDLFLGPAPYRPYNSCYVPFRWRGWWDFGTGALGDMACHILDPVFRALKLKYPVSVIGSSTKVNTETAPHSEIVHFIYPERGKIGKLKLPEVKVTWYDGGLLPERPVELPESQIMGDSSGGALFIGSKDKLMCGCYGAKPYLLSGRTPASPKVMRVSGEHHQDWIRACKESPENRVSCHSDFEYAGPFNEMVVMGVLAVRLQSLNRWLKWDGENMRFTNISDSDILTIANGNSAIKETSIEMNAKLAAGQFVKYTYREGWDLPKV